MRQSAYRILALAAFASLGTAQADGWRGQVELGAIATTGNTETTTLNSKAKLTHKRARWQHTVGGSAARSSEDGETTSERYQALLRSELSIAGDTNYLFANFDYEKDLFGGVRERTSQTVGYGRRLLQGERHMLDLELGAGARQQLSQQPASERSSEAIGRAALKYGYTISETSRFAQSLKTEAGNDNVYTESVSELKLSLLGRLFVKLGFTAKHNSEVPVGAEHTDTISSVTLSWEFGQ